MYKGAKLDAGTLCLVASGVTGEEILYNAGIRRPVSMKKENRPLARL
jgi:hypothetical protein